MTKHKDMELYNELEKYTRDKPSKFSESKMAAVTINRLEELPKEEAIKHYTVIYLLILHYYYTRDMSRKIENKHPYGMNIVGKNKNTGPLKCVMSKIPPVLQKIIVAYVGLYMLEDD